MGRRWHRWHRALFPPLRKGATPLERYNRDMGMLYLYLGVPGLGLITLVVVVLTLVGCTRGIPLRHADGRTATCGGSTMVGIAAQLRAADRDAACVADFQRQGFERRP